MNDIYQNIITAFMAQSWLEVVAVITALLYLILVVKENIWCWFFGFISTGIYIYLFHSVSLLSESILNVYYLIMAIFGWWQWSNKSYNQSNKIAVKITYWPINIHVKIAIGTVLLTPIIGYLMDKLGASFPYIDAFVAILAVVATLMTTKKIFENWYYWLLVDTISIYLFWQKQMYLTAVLFMFYIVFIFVGINAWKRIMAR